MCVHSQTSRVEKKKEERHCCGHNSCNYASEHYAHNDPAKENRKRESNDRKAESASDRKIKSNDVNGAPFSSRCSPTPSIAFLGSMRRNFLWLLANRLTLSATIYLPFILQRAKSSAISSFPTFHVSLLIRFGQAS